MEELFHSSLLPVESRFKWSPKISDLSEEAFFNNGKGEKEVKTEKANLVKCKGSNTIRGQLHSIKQRHLDQPMSFCASAGPVLVTLHLKETRGTFRADAHQSPY